MFDDSLPDGWGLLLMDRFLRKQGVDIDRLSVLDRLAFLGRHTMGALIYEPAAKHEKTEKTLDLEALALHSRQIMEGEAVDILPALMKAGGSPGGEHSMSISGEGGAPGKKEVFRLGEKTGLSVHKIRDIIGETAASIERWPNFAKAADVNDQTRNQIWKKIKQNLSFF